MKKEFQNFALSFSGQSFFGRRRHFGAVPVAGSLLRALAVWRNGVWGTSGDLELACNEAVLSRGRGAWYHPQQCWDRLAKEFQNLL